MQISNEGLALTESSEGLRLKAYQDTGGVWTIGYGHTNGVRPNQVITKEVAEQLLKLDQQAAANCINQHCLPCTQGQFDALTDFVFNVGPAQFLSSHLFTYHRLGEYDKAADEFPKWKYDNGRVIPGLVKRRAAEQALYIRQGPPVVHQQTSELGHSVPSVPYPVPAESPAASSPPSQVPTGQDGHTVPASGNTQSEFLSQAWVLIRKLLGKG